MNNWRVTYSDELYHHGVKGMKWGVRRYQPYGQGGYDPNGRPHMKRMSKRQAKRAFKRDFENERRQVMESDKEYSTLKKKLNDFDSREAKKSPGYEYGDFYVPDWRSVKGNDKTAKKMRWYSETTDKFEKAEENASLKATQHMMEKYGGRSWQEAYRANKSAIKKGRASADKVASMRWNQEKAKHYMDAYNKVSDRMNNGGIDAHNSKWEKTIKSTGGTDSDWSKSSRYSDYLNDYQNEFNRSVDDELRRKKKSLGIR